jgi:hypothetical protein
MPPYREKKIAINIAAWRHGAIGEEDISKHISMARRATEEGGRHQRKTSGVASRFIAPALCVDVNINTGGAQRKGQQKRYQTAFCGISLYNALNLCVAAAKI